MKTLMFKLVCIAVFFAVAIGCGINLNNKRFAIWTSYRDDQHLGTMLEFRQNHYTIYDWSEQKMLTPIESGEYRLANDTVILLPNNYSSILYKQQFRVQKETDGWILWKVCPGDSDINTDSLVSIQGIPYKEISKAYYRKIIR